MTSLELCVDISINTCCLCHVFSVNKYVVRETSHFVSFESLSNPILGLGRAIFK